MVHCVFCIRLLRWTKRGLCCSCHQPGHTQLVLQGCIITLESPTEFSEFHYYTQTGSWSHALKDLSNESVCCPLMSASVSVSVSFSVSVSVSLSRCGATSGFEHLPFNLTLTHSHTHTQCLSLVLVVMIKSKELKTKISLTHSLILSLSRVMGIDPQQ